MNSKTIDAWRQAMQALADDEDAAEPDPPASTSDIEFAERTLQRKLPEDLVAMLRCSRSWQWREEEFDAVIFSSPEEIVSDTLQPEDEHDEIAVSEALSPKVKAVFYSPQRLTIAYSDYHFFQIDDDPAAGGKPGQIVVIDHEAETIDVIADSLEAFVARGIACLQAQAAGGYPN